MSRDSLGFLELFEDGEAHVFVRRLEVVLKRKPIVHVLSGGPQVDGDHRDQQDEVVDAVTRQEDEQAAPDPNAKPTQGQALG